MDELVGELMGLSAGFLWQVGRIEIEEERGRASIILGLYCVDEQ